MVIYSLQLIPNSVFWWIMQSADRYIITFMLSSNENGLYAVANKIPTIISTVSTVFFQAWQISSVEEAQSVKKNDFYSNIFDALSTVLIISTSAIMVVLQPLYKLLTERAYYSGWTSTPFLLCAMVFSCYSSFLGTNYVAMKKTKGVFLTTITGALVNVLLNIALTPIMGIEGTALATFISFFVTWGSRVFGTRKFVKIKYLLLTFWLPTVLMVVQAILLTVGVHSMMIQLMFFIVIMMLYSKKIIEFIIFALSFLKKNRGVI